MHKKKYYQITAAESLEQLHTSENGLEKNQVHQRLHTYGKNILVTKKEISWVKIALNQFKDFIVYLLLVALVLTLLLGEIMESIVIVVVIFVNALIGFYQEYSAQRSLRSIENLVSEHATVKRGGVLKTIPASMVVPGDILYITAGERIAADCRVIHAQEMSIDESSLTGESLPVKKSIQKIDRECGIGDRINMMYASTIATSGNGIGVVISTGKKTEIGKISRLIAEQEEVLTPLQMKLKTFGLFLGKIIIAICCIVFVVLLTKALIQQTTDTYTAVVASLLVAVSLAVAAVPTGLPTAVTVALSVGVIRLAKVDSIVKKLSAVETLGSCDIICTDKTGTLTQNKMFIKYLVLPDGMFVEHYDITKKHLGVLHSMAYASDARMSFVGETYQCVGDPMECAAIEMLRKNDAYEDYKESYYEIPFTSERKMMSRVIKSGQTKIMYTKGAPERVLDICEYVIGSKQKVLTSKKKKELKALAEELASKAYRVLAVAQKKVSTRNTMCEHHMAFVGFVVFYDPPRREVLASLEQCKEAGIRTIMITGDHQNTAKAIAKEVGIETKKVISGQELDQMSDAELEKHIESVNVYARVAPEHKMRIVRLLQSRYHRVGMIGDGVNDAPSIKQSDIGVAVGSGTDVAKEASDFVLMNDSFSTVVLAVQEGRGIFTNIRKVVQLLLSGNIMEVGIVFLGSLFFNLPLTAIMLLWINMITDGVPAIAYSFDTYDESIMKKPPQEQGAEVFAGEDVRFTLARALFGTIGALFVFQMYAENLILAQTVTFTFVMVYELLLVYIIRGLYSTPFFSNAWLHLAVLFSFVMHLMALYSPLAVHIGTVALGITQWAVILATIGVISICFYGYLYYVERERWQINKYYVRSESFVDS